MSLRRAELSDQRCEMVLNKVGVPRKRSAPSPIQAAPDSCANIEPRTTGSGGYGRLTIGEGSRASRSAVGPRSAVVVAIQPPAQTGWQILAVQDGEDLPAEQDSDHTAVTLARTSHRARTALTVVRGVGFGPGRAGHVAAARGAYGGGSQRPPPAKGMR